MSKELLYTVATLLTLLGWLLVLRVVILGARLVFGPGGSWRDLVAACLGAACLFLVEAAMPKASVESEGPWRLPLSWVAMPFSAWLCLVSGVMVGVRLVQGALDLNPREKWGRFQAAGIWTVAAVAGYWLYGRDPANKIQFFNGGISFTPGTAVALVLLAVAGCVAMVAAGRATTSRGYSKSIVTQATLLAGSVVFGLPFVFLLITSFKEPLDMSSPTGIVWIPKVSQTVPYMDKADPQYETTYQGTPVVAHVVKRRNDGTALLDVLKPANMAGFSVDARLSDLKEVPRDAAVVTGTYNGQQFQGVVIEEMQNGHKRVAFTSPASLADQQHVFQPTELTPVRKPGLNLSNYPESLEYLPREANGGLVYLQNTLILVVLNVLGTLLSSTIVAYAFSRMQFPGRNVLFGILLSTMMLPSAVTLLPKFLIWRDLHAIDTLYPLWVGAFFGSAFNIFLLRQFFLQIPMELEDAAKIDGCSYLRTFGDVMVPQIKPALAVIAIWTFLAAWNDFMGPLIYVNSPEHMTLSYALQQFQSDRFNDEPGLVMAFATMCMVPVLALFFFCQRYFIEGVTLSGLGGR